MLRSRGASSGEIQAAPISQAHGQEALGRLYCLIDVAKMMAYNPAYKVIHLQAELDGDPYCELVTRETTDQEREDFASNADWSHADSDTVTCP